MEKREVLDVTTRVIAICDDEEIYRTQCRNMCQAYFKNYELKAELLEFSSAAELMANKKQINLIFLDIEMPGLSGIEAKRMLAKTQPRAAIVFITNYPDYKDLAFGKNVYYFIRKPLDFKQIYLAINQINKDLTFDEDHIIIDSQRIILSQVLYLRGEDKYIRFVLYGSESILIRETMKYWEEKLRGRTFLRIHKSYMVNLQWIRAIKLKVHLKNGETLPISKHLKKELIKEYHVFLEDLAY